MEPDSAARGLRAILISTVIAGVVGYVIQIAAPALLPSRSAYVSFSVFWSTLYLWVSALSGIQQEVSRATLRTASVPKRASPLRLFAVVGVLVVCALVLVFAMSLGDRLIPGGMWWLAGALSLGVAGYILTATLGGVLYGLRLWRAVAFTTIVDALVRALLVVPGLAVHVGTGWLAIMVAAPFVVAFTLTWLTFRRRVVGSFELDVGLRTLVTNATSTVVAATASGVMISGLPMVIGATSARDSAATTGALLLTITLTRAPIVVPVIALQSFLISAVFRGGALRRPLVVRVALLSAAALLVLAAAGGLLGPMIISFVSAGRFVIGGWIVAVVVVSAGLTAAMCATGPALIAAREHAANLVGWVSAAVLTVIVLMLPLPEDLRVLVALTGPVVVGLAIHCVSLRMPRSEPAAQ
jgi:hypothetical protein